MNTKENEFLELTASLNYSILKLNVGVPLNY